MSLLRPPPAVDASRRRGCPGPSSRRVRPDVLALGRRGLGLAAPRRSTPRRSPRASRAERELADRRVDDAGLVDPELDLAGLDLLRPPCRRRASRCRSSGWASGPGDRAPCPSRPTTRIMSGVATTASKSSQPPWIFLASSSPPTKSAPASSASLTFSPQAKTSTRIVLPGAVRQHHRAAHHLVGVLGIDAEAHGDLHGLVELGEGDVLRRARPPRRAGTAAAPTLAADLLRYFLPCFATSIRPRRPAQPSTSMPIERAVPSTIRIAASRLAGVQVRHLGLRDLLDLLLRDLADLVLVRLARALLDPRRLSSRIAAGGVLVMKV